MMDRMGELQLGNRRRRNWLRTGTATATAEFVYVTQQESVSVNRSTDTSGRKCVSVFVSVTNDVAEKEEDGRSTV